MALTAADLRDEIDAQMSDIVGADYDALGPELKASFATAIANAVFVWLTGGLGQSGILPGADVSTTVSVTSVSGVTTGPGVSGPGSGTGTGGIS